MAILHEHLTLHHAIYRTPGILSDPVLTFGAQHLVLNSSVVSRGALRRARTLWRAPNKWKLIRRRLRQEIVLRTCTPPMFTEAKDFAGVLRNYGATTVETLDHLDPQADIRHDMNLPLPSKFHERYGTFIDIGCIEHVFDTAQCLENCMRVVRVGGHCVLHTPVKGYFGHGLHVFDPDGLVSAFEVNGFRIVSKHFSTEHGTPLDNPARGDDVLIWLVGRKERTMASFVAPQQAKWEETYVRS